MMVVRYRYSEWDGTQEIPPLDPDDILNALTDDLMNFGDLQHALRNLLQRGMRDPMGQRMQGLRDLLQQLRQQRRQTLDRYNLSSAFEDLKKRLNEILQMEKETIQRRLEDAQQASRPEDGQMSSDATGSQGDSTEKGDGSADTPPSESGQDADGEGKSSGRSGSPMQAPGGQAGPRGLPDSGKGEAGDQQREFARMLENIAGRK